MHKPTADLGANAASRRIQNVNAGDVQNWGSVPVSGVPNAEGSNVPFQDISQADSDLMPSSLVVATRGADALEFAMFHIESLGALAYAIAQEAKQDKPDVNRLNALERLADYLAVDWRCIADDEASGLREIERALRKEACHG